jgi:D-alanyl-D-alanine dipeptidase
MYKWGAALLMSLLATTAIALPEGFVYLNQIDPSIQQDIRYAGYHNFIGRPIRGYYKPTCILTVQAAEALSKVQADLKPLGLSLKVYDCFRPQMAVSDFYSWSFDATQQQMKAEFYPREDKSQLFALGYIAKSSGHTRGSTVDLTIVKIHAPADPSYKPGQPLTACYNPVNKRYADNSVDMGTGYDCMDEAAHVDNKLLPDRAYQNRMALRYFMLKNGFEPYSKEWWHFTLKNEPYPNKYFNFPVT